MSRYPSASQFFHENDLKLEVRRSLRSVISKMALFFFSVVAVYAVIFAVPDGEIPDIPYFGSISLRWLALIPIALLVEIVRKYHDDVYLFTSSKVTHHEGRLSLTSSLPVLKYSDIRSLMVNQDLCGRILDYGEVALSSAGSDGTELLITGVRAPIELAKLIEDLRMHYILQNLRDFNREIPQQEPAKVA